MRNSNSPRIEIAGHRDADTGEIDIVVYLDGEQYESPLWHIFDATTWAEDGRDTDDRIPLSLWRAAAQKVASEGSVAFSSMITAYSTIDERNCTVNDLYPAKDAQPDVTTVDELDPARWYRAANSTLATTAVSAAHGVLALRAFHASEADTVAGKVEAMLTAYKAATHYFSGTLTETVTSLLENLRQFAVAREIQIEARPHHTDAIACALMELLGALQECATTVWAEQLTHEATESGTSLRDALAEDVFAGIKEIAYQRYFEEIIRKP